MSTTSPAAEEQGIGGAGHRRSPDTLNSNVAKWEAPASRSSNGHRAPSSDTEMERLARALGWFSLGLGLAQIAAPSKVAQLIGVDDDDATITMMRVVGAREIASGIGILTQPKPTPWLWARVGGDAMDLTLLKSAMESPRANRNRVATATTAVLGIAAVDALCGTRLTAEPDAPNQSAIQSSAVHATSAVTVNAPIDMVYGYWEGFQNLPRFMSDFASVQVSGNRQSRWSLTAPAGISVDWEVEITETTPNEQIAWRTSEGSHLEASGFVRFRTAPANRGTEVLFDARFDPPGGELGRKVAGFFADALGTKIGNDLRRFKQLVELGEIVHSDDSLISGPNPAQPPRDIPAGRTQSASTS